MIELDVAVRRERFALEVECRTGSQVTAVVGPSGSGKSTLLRAIAGLVETTGRIVIDGVVILDSGSGVALPPERRAIGWVPQNAALFPHRSVRWNIEFATSRRGRFDDLVTLLRLEALLERNAATLSGGERQRVALARALLREPRLLLLDEPMASVDRAMRVSIVNLLRTLLAEMPVPTLIATHQPEEALALATDAIRLVDGRVSGRGISAIDDATGGDQVNVLMVIAISRRGDGVASVRTAGGLEIVVPEWFAATSCPFAISIGADEPMLFGRRPESLSARNVIEGEVVSLREGDDGVEVTLRAGEEFRLRVTRQAAQELGLGPGGRVWMAIRTHGLRLLG